MRVWMLLAVVFEARGVEEWCNAIDVKGGWVQF